MLKLVVSKDHLNSQDTISLEKKSKGKTLLRLQEIAPLIEAIKSWIEQEA